ncbi:MAG TPA: diguanylate cyclase [Acidimicrobiia bacterium]|nr:diguanylate cyclase [Acidimicrobiia bacterium]
MVGLTVVVGAMAAGLAWSQSASRRELAERFQTRGEVGARFVETFAVQLLEREAFVAGRQLAGDRADSRRFSDVVDAFGFEAALLLDSSGRVLHGAPPNPALVGERITDQYDHLRQAVAGTMAVSNVVPSAVRSEPVVAFAAPFDTPQGRWVFSGAHPVSATPLGAFLRHALPITPHGVYLIDGNGVIVASDPATPGPRPLRDGDGALARALERHRAGAYHPADGPEYYFSAHRVERTPWTLVVAAPTSLLFGPVMGSSRMVPWFILAVLAAVGAVALAVMIRYVEGRRALAQLNVELEYMSRTDPVTGLYNRRHLEEHLRLALSAARRHSQPLSVLLADIDHFKSINDRFGHETGDRVLRSVADRFRASLRAEDVVARWGGEEFVVVLPLTSASGAMIAAERLRIAIAESPVPADGTAIPVTISLGCTTATDADPDELLRRCDDALYEAKAAGRNSVVAADPPR